MQVPVLLRTWPLFVTVLQSSSRFRASLIDSDLQSKACQNENWNAHKYSCSPLPPEGLTPAISNCNDELQKEVGRVTEILKRWTEALQAHEKSDPNASKTKYSYASLPESVLIAGT
jgi:hypothetical protein